MNNTFIFHSKFYQQTEGYTMGVPLSVTLANIFLTKLEKDCVQPLHSKMYKRYVDNVFTRRNKNKPDELLRAIIITTTTLISL